MIGIFFLLALAPDARAKDLAARLPAARSAMRELRLAAAAIPDQPLRAAVEAQLLAPWLPPEAWAVAHPAEAEKLLRAEGLLDAPLALPGQRGSFAAACGGGHHAYPGGLAVHSWTDLLHARGLAEAYEKVYGVKLRDDWLVAAAIWHDSLKAATLPWHDDANCGPEQPIAGTAAHHVLAIASAMLRRLPEPLVLTIASAHAPVFGDGAKSVCSWMRAAFIVAEGRRLPGACPATAPIEGYVMNLADSDYPLTVTAASWYAAHAPAGWERFEAMIQDGSDLAAWVRGTSR